MRVLRTPRQSSLRRFEGSLQTHGSFVEEPVGIVGTIAALAAATRAMILPARWLHCCAMPWAQGLRTTIAPLSILAWTRCYQSSWCKSSKVQLREIGVQRCCTTIRRSMPCATTSAASSSLMRRKIFHYKLNMSYRPMHLNTSSSGCVPS